jgi:hypothetical protein
MKSITTGIFLVLIAVQANADGFYQQIVGNAPQVNQGISSEVAETTYSPLYKQVTASVDIHSANETIGPRRAFNFTPLYLQVVGPQKPWSVSERVAQLDAEFNY